MGDFRWPDFSIKQGQEYMVTVRGWVMLKNVKPGNYRIKIVDRGWHGRCVNFYRPRGNKVLVCHTLGNCALSHPDNPDLNAIIVTKTIADYDPIQC